MKFPAKLGIAKRLYCVLAILVASLTGLASFSWSDLSRVSDLAAATEDLRVPQLQRIAAIELNVIRASLQIRHAMLVKSPEDLQATLADIGQRRQLIEKSASDYRAGLTDTADLNDFKEFEKLAAEFWPIADANVALAKRADMDAAFNQLVRETIPARNRLLVWLDRAKKRQGDELKTELAAIRTNADQTRLQLAALVAAVATGMTLFFLHIVRLVRRRIAAAQAVANRVSRGDLTVAIADPHRDEFTPLVDALADMQRSLVRIVSGVRQGTEAMLSASSQIATGNQDLSARTEQQASSLQETAASMVQLTSTVRQNATSAMQANQLAVSASDVARRGGSVVNQVVHTMGSINEASGKIVEIVGVIEGIAFQTNILALNAAVEAARAGEQGRGFAVVASEVRNLAQRSAAAAKEIKQLIGDSVEKIGRGSKLVGEAGETMDEVVASVKRVTDIMSDIASASAEQSAGIEQVNLSIIEMDGMTQQNAALVEEAAAAFQSLQDQAAELQRVVSIFKLAEGEEQAIVDAPAPAAATASRAVVVRPAAKPRLKKPAAAKAKKPAQQERAADAPASTAKKVAAAAASDDWEEF